MREKIRNQASTRRYHYSVRSYVLNQLDRIAAKTWVATLAVSLGLASSLWFATEVHTTQIAQAETYNVSLSIDRRNNESYESLVNRAEALAKATVDESFAQNRDATDVSITVVGRHHGAIAPILSLKVGRDRWSRAAANRWMTHFSQARSLLYFDEDAANTNSNNQQQTNRPGFRPQLRNNTPSSQPGNFTPNRNRPGPRSTGTFSQPGRQVDPAVPGQTTNTPLGQPSNTNTANPSPGQNATTGNDSNSQPLANPAASPNQPQNSTLPATGSNSTSQPLANPAASPNQPQNSTSPGGTNLTPQPAAPQPLTPSGNSQSQNQPSNSNSGFPTNSNTTSTGNAQDGTP